MKILSNIAVIPARKGSKRFPGKNRVKIHGKSLVELAILCAADTRIFDKIIVSTDDEYFFELAKIYPFVIIHKRPVSISTDSATPFDVLSDLERSYFNKGDLRYCYLQPTSPLRIKDDIINSISDNSISVYYDEFNKHNNSHNVIKTLQKLGLHDDLKCSLRELKNLYFNGLFYWVNTEILKEQCGFIGPKTTFFKTPFERSYDIDYEEEFKEVELRFNKIMGFENDK